MRDPRHPEDLLSAFLDDELDESTATRVQRHLLDCPACMAELDGLRGARNVLRGLPAVAPPADVFHDVPTAAATADEHHWARLMLAGVAAGLSGLMVLAFALGGTDRGDVVPPVEVMVVDHVVRTGGGPVIQPVDLDR